MSQMPAVEYTVKVFHIKLGLLVSNVKSLIRMELVQAYSIYKHKVHFHYYL
jgi:hypothetical protein